MLYERRRRGSVVMDVDHPGGYSPPSAPDTTFRDIPSPPMLSTLL
jgi:hypothetical protein